jgi:hypothetical protein
MAASLPYRHTLSRPKPATAWPPLEYCLPDTLAAIELGRPLTQLDLFEVSDDSRAGRVARIVASVTIITTVKR